MNMDEKLGRALARLVLETKHDALNDGSAASGQGEMMRTLRERLSGLKASGTGGRGVSGLPEKECAQHGAYMEGNVDFFLDHLLSRNRENACPGLIRHINDCYRCFEIYAGVMRGYVLEQRTIRERQNTP
jgi:hypothetical protein